MSNRLVPKVRFKGFNKYWEKDCLYNAMNNFKYGLSVSSKNYDGYNKYLRITDINDFNHQFDYDDLTSPNLKSNKNNDYLLNNGDIVFARTGNSTGKTYLYNFNDGKVYYAGFLIRAHTSKNFDSKFLFNQTLTNKYDKFIKIMSQRSGQPGINSQELSTFKFYSPSLFEQQKIGQFFSKLDQLIDLQSQKLSHLKQLKKGYLQKMFSQKGKSVPRLRFDGFRDEWHKSKLNELAYIKTGNKNVEDNVHNGQYAFFDRSTQIKYLNTYDYNEKVIVYPGEGAKFLPKYFDGKYSLHQRAYGLYNFNNINPLYLYYFLNTKSNTFVRFSVGTTAKSLRKDTFKHVFVGVPNQNEQKEISLFFKNIDILIKQNEKKLINLKHLKKAYLQKMFV